MKKKFLHLIMVLLAAVAMPLVSCSDNDPDEIITPNFPEERAVTVEPGGTFTLNLEPNQDWEVSVPEATFKWYKIQDGSQKVWETRGSAGAVTIVIEVSADESFEEIPEGVVTMTMNKQSKVIARITRGTEGRELTIREALVDENGLVFDPESSLTYKYGDPTEEINLISFGNNTVYLMHILVEANYDWVLREWPEWIEEPSVLTGLEGAQTPVYLRSDSKNLPLEDAKGKIVFAAKDNEDAIMEVEVSIPGSADFFYLPDGNQTMLFSGSGLYNQSEDIWVEATGKGRVLSPDGYEFYIFNESGSSFSSAAAAIEWIIFAETVADEEEVVKTVNFTVGVKENPTKQSRNGVIYALPKSLAEKVSNPDNIPTNADYDDYIVATIEQRPTDGPVKELNYGSMNGPVTGFGFSLLADDDDYSAILDWNWALPGDEFRYKLIYTGTPPSDELVALVADREFTSEYIQLDGNEVWTGNPWLTLEKKTFTRPSGTTTDGFVIGMDPAKINMMYGSPGLMTLSSEGKIFAAIVCIYDEDYDFTAGQEKFAVELSDLAENMTLIEFTKDNYLDVLGGIVAPSKLAYLEDNNKSWLNITSGPMYWLKQTAETIDFPLLSANRPYGGPSISPYSVTVDAGGWLDWSHYGIANEYVSVNMQKPDEDAAFKVGMLQFLNTATYSPQCIVFCEPDW